MVWMSITYHLACTMRTTYEVRQQTVEEWLSDLTGKSIQPEPVAQPVLLQYIDFNTIKVHRGGVALNLEEMETGASVVAFFNVDITYQRGKKKGMQKRIGRGQPFLPLYRSKFRKFWQGAVGKEPRRWSEVHKEMHKLSDLVFTAEIKTAYDSDERPFNKAVNLRVYRDKPTTCKRQLGDNKVTTNRQITATDISTNIDQ